MNLYKNVQKRKINLIEYFGEKMTLSDVKCYFALVNIFLALLLQNVVVCEKLNAHVSLDVDGEGFHRYLTYQVNFDDCVDGCYIALFFTLPCSLYANINELNDLSRLGINTACAIGETDVELFTDKAVSQNITICSFFIGAKTILKLPIHQRYLHVNENSSHSPVTLQKPSLLLGCKKRIRDHRTSKIDLCSPCVQLVSKWREIPYKDIEDIVWTIPVGNSSMVSVVTYVTLLITILFTIFLLQTIRKSIPKPDKKRL